MIGILCPSVFEFRYIRSMKLDPKKAALVCSGMGKIRALDACHRLQKHHPGLRHILLAGYAGGLSGLKVGDRIEPNVFIEYDYDARPFERYPNTLTHKTKCLLGGSRSAAIVTQDRFLTSNPFTGTPLARKHPQLACDMESYAVAYFSRTSKIPATVLKFISDEADADAEHDFLKACRRLSGRLKESVREAVRVLA